MEGNEGKSTSHSYEEIRPTFSEFLSRILKIEELGAVGIKFLTGFQKGLEFLRRPPINDTSELVQNIIKANETKRLKSYMEAGYITSHDRVQRISDVKTCLHLLHEHLSKVKQLLVELECLLDDAGVVVKADCESSCYYYLEQEETAPAVPPSRVIDVADFASLMAVIYSMVKQDFVMQERVVSSLNLKTSAGELESYCLMWSLRPMVNDDVIHEALRLVP
ncbi:hypothetical protein Nepgr_012936 [Nepenthes gracilis]|uniref:DUF7795 domain-containing protein n=1 Tax=Nepenthes gracilis TaxID=150966 RepID=A0AAD3SHT5_NEPGR|nr:hypothetical protein Nepgr_012936 [Nepenthes gracilis]